MTVGCPDKAGLDNRVSAVYTRKNISGLSVNQALIVQALHLLFSNLNTAFCPYVLSHYVSFLDKGQRSRLMARPPAHSTRGVTSALSN